MPFPKSIGGKVDGGALSQFIMSGSFVDDKLRETFIPKVRPVFYLEWADSEGRKFRGTFDGNPTLEAVRAGAGADVDIEIGGIEMLLNGSWLLLPQTREKLLEMYYFTGQYPEDESDWDNSPEVKQ